MDKRITINVVAGDTITIAGSTPWNLAGYTITSTIKDNYGAGNTIASFTSSPNGANGFILSMSAGTSSSALTPYIGADDLAFDIKFVSGGGAVTHAEKAFLKVNKAVT